MLPEPEPAGPPWVLNCRTVVVALPEPPAVAAVLPPRVPVTVAWPRVRVTGDRLPPPPGVIRLAAPPQGPWRLPLPGGLVYMLAHPIPARAD